MKKFIVTMLVAAFFTAPVLAQDKGKNMAEWDNKVKTELQLTEEQTVKYDAVNKEFSDKMEGLKQETSLSKEAQMERKMQMKKEKESRLQQILTPEQMMKYKELTDKKKKDKPAPSGS